MFKNIVSRDLEIQVKYISPCEFMHDLYIAEIYRADTKDYLISGDSVGLSSTKNAKEKS